MLLLLLVALWAPWSALADVTVPVSQHWQTGFEANACFTITEEMTSWKMHLKFDQPIPSIEPFTAEIESVNADKTEYILTPKSYNAVEHVGDQLCTEFQGHTTSDITPVITASLEGVTGGGTIVVTARPTVATMAPMTTRTLGPGETWPPTTPRPGRLTIRGKDFYKDEQKVFLSGVNTPWSAYGFDFGNNQYKYRRSQFQQKISMVHEAGGNSMRTWVHIHGATSPAFDANGFVTGLDKDGTFISDFLTYLDDSLAKDVLVFPTLWNGALIQEKPEYLHGLITETDKLQSYLDNGLIPWVNAVKNHPALGGWDIINEFEGFLIPDTQDSEPCFDTTGLKNSGAGWAGHLYTAHDILRFINWQADAIYRADPQALVTAGSWSQTSQTDCMGLTNYYNDTCLVKAGGKPKGKLNFFSTHSYSWNGKFAAEAVFNHNASDYCLDRPLVVAEFMQKQAAGLTDVQMFNYVYTHGYQGAWVWSEDSAQEQSAGMAAIRDKDGPAGKVHFTL